MKTLLQTCMIASGLLLALQPGSLSAQQFTDIDTTYQTLGNEVCATCHAPYGQGNPVVGAPSLAGLEPWYLKNQLEKFRAGWRGAQKDYIPAYEMQATVSNISNAEIETLIAEVTSWPEPEPEVYGDGNAESGKLLYANCATCHGTAAEGNQALQAPGLADRDAWYLVRQLNLFRSGYRGGNPADTVGAGMRTWAATLDSEQAVMDVVAYINTLGR